MTNKDSFKIFVSKHPELIKYVNNNEMTWQKFYEMYDLYGENNDIWNKYNDNDEKSDDKTTEILNFIKKINLDKLQSGMESVSRVLSLVSEIGNKPDLNNKEEYNPRPIYKHFED